MDVAKPHAEKLGEARARGGQKHYQSPEIGIDRERCGDAYDIVIKSLIVASCGFIGVVIDDGQP